MNHTLYAVFSFLLLGVGIGYALGSSRTAKKYAVAAKQQASDVNIKVDKLEVKVDGNKTSRDQDVSDLSDRIDEDAATQVQDMSDMSDRIDVHHPDEGESP